ncbi:MAG: serine hydrolase [Gemmatimonadales bacterium]|nr:serine hydrolase [Gemmatimonadales bacterium]
MTNLGVVRCVFTFLNLSWALFAGAAQAQDWQVATPESQGMDSERLAEAVQYLMDHEPSLHSLHVIRNGYLVADVYFHPFQATTKHDIASITKSVLATVLGIAVDRSLIADVNQPILELFPGQAAIDLNPRKRAITIEHLLTMRSGLAWGESGDVVSLFQMMQSPDWVRFVLDRPVSHEPGTKFRYNSGGAHLLSAAVHRATGMTAGEFARQHLFEPLGIVDVDWPTDPWGRDNTGWGNIRMRPLDLAKIGFLYLNGGSWHDRRVLSQDWINAATRQLNAEGLRGYGYLWWLRAGTVCALGRGGQNLFLFPAESMVVVMSGGGSYNEDDRLRFVTDHLLAAIRMPGGSLPDNPGGLERLRNVTERAARFEAEPVQATPLPDLAERISGVSFTLEPNQFGILELTLTFAGVSGASLKLALALDSDRDPEYRIGLDGVPRLAEGRFGIPAASVGAWESEDVFLANIDEIGNINKFRIAAAFEGSRVTLRINEQTGLGSVTVRGTRR